MTKNPTSQALWLCPIVLLLIPTLFAQSPNAAITGQVSDASKALLIGAKVTVINNNTSLRYEGMTNRQGAYLISSVPPGDYRIEVEKTGFRTLIKPDVVLHVQDTIELNFEMAVGSLSEIVTVTGGAPLVNTENASVSTVVDRNFAENLPMNGRSFQTLIQLSPGVVQTASNYADNGQFSVNGQRAASNYWMVDGVSANVGMSAGNIPGNALSGSLGAFSAQGGTNSLVSVDAMQEFRIQTSSYAPEFGRTPGGQISIVTRSGTNRFHGTAFDYFRNDILDANDWFNGFTHTPPLPKAEERQNDFGGTLSGPVVKDRLFFFFSYEGLRLRLPQTKSTTVPDVAARQAAIPALQPYLNAYPLPNGVDLGNGIAEFNKTFSDASTLDAYSLRFDYNPTERLTLFGRYNHSPSNFIERGGVPEAVAASPPLFALSVVEPLRVSTDTATIGSTFWLSPLVVNDLRFNWSRTNASSSYYLDNFGGAVPIQTMPFPSPYSTKDALFVAFIASLSGGQLADGENAANAQRQVNLVETLSYQLRSHSLRFGVDFRRLSPTSAVYNYLQGPIFLDMQAAESGNLNGGFSVGTNVTPTLLFRNLGAFVQDTWQMPRLTLTYGVRWDVDFSPRSLSGPTLPAVSGFSERNLSNLSLAPLGTSAYSTTLRNLAPRIGLTYAFVQNANWQSVFKSGAGIFYDLASSEVGNLVGVRAYPFGANRYTPTGQFPLTPADAAPPIVQPPTASNQGVLTALNPHLKLPYTVEWNVAIQQGMGENQAFSTSYVGARGRRLLQSEFVFPANVNYGFAQLSTNAATSGYDALQLQFERRMSSGLQALASYTWAHSIDTASAGSTAIPSNGLVPNIQNQNRGPSDFDIRHAFSAALTYDIPNPKTTGKLNVLLQGWSLENVLQARSAPPVDVYNSGFGFLSNGFLTNVRPDVVSGIPLYSYGSQYPGGKILNNAPNEAGTGCLGPFCTPPIDPTTGLPLRQGNLSRNALRGFGAVQWDFAMHRDFPLREQVKLQFRAELFNVLNHPNFGQPVGDLFSPQFGYSTQMLGQSLATGNLGGGAFSPLYQIGGPRSIQLALKLAF